MKVAVFAVLVLTLVATAQAAHWAVLIAGSNGFWNYRHQTDIAHAYNLLLKNGIPASNIITFMYDDIANDEENPFPGQLFNHPTPKGVAGVDVYAAVKGKIDYSGDALTPANFLAVLTGNASAIVGGSGKVLQSTEKDDVFINFSDHGGTDVLEFIDDELHVKDLTAAITYMYKNKKYGKLVFYLEACESGSMFEGQGWEKMNAYGMSASLPDESSWGYYCGEDEGGDDSVNGTAIGSCLGDLFSINWMEDSDKASVATETLKQQFDIVYNLTSVGTKSGEFSCHPQQYGANTTYNSLSVLEFLGTKSSSSSSRHHARASPSSASQLPPRRGRGVPAADAKLHSIYRRYSLAVKAGDLPRINKLSTQLQDEIAVRTKLDNVFAALTKKFAPDAETAQSLLMNPATAYEKSEERTACYRELIAAFTAPGSCGRNDYNVKYLRVLSNVCAYAVDADVSTSSVAAEVTRLCA